MLLKVSVDWKEARKSSPAADLWKPSSHLMIFATGFVFCFAELKKSDGKDIALESYLSCCQEYEGKLKTGESG